MPLIELALGFVLVTIGLCATILALAFWTRAGRALPAFGGIVLLYGCRLLVASPVLLPQLGLTSTTANYVIWGIN